MFDSELSQLSVLPIGHEGWRAGFSVLSALMLLCLSVAIGLLLTRVMQSKGFKTHPVFNLILTGILAVVLYLRFGLGILAVQGMALFFILLYAACSDLTSHTVDDSLWVMVGILGLLSVQTVGWASMLTGAVMVFAPQMLFAMLSSGKSLGGADIKLSTAIAFLLGWQKGLIALVLGLLLAVIVMSIAQKNEKKKKKQPFALVPFLAVAAVVIFIL